MECSICKGEIPAKGNWTEGNNAQPINDGRCCDTCNESVVLIARINQMKRNKFKTQR